MHVRMHILNIFVGGAGNGDYNGDRNGDSDLESQREGDDVVEVG